LLKLHCFIKQGQISFGNLCKVYKSKS